MVNNVSEELLTEPQSIDDLAGEKNPKVIFDFLYSNLKSKEDHVSLSRMCYQILEKDLHLGSLFYAVSSFSSLAKRGDQNAANALGHFKSNNLGKIKEAFYLKHDSKEERDSFMLGIKYSLFDTEAGTKDFFQVETIDDTTKDNLLYFMSAWQVRSTKERTQDEIAKTLANK